MMAASWQRLRDVDGGIVVRMGEERACMVEWNAAKDRAQVAAAKFIFLPGALALLAAVYCHTESEGRPWVLALSTLSIGLLVSCCAIQMVRNRRQAHRFVEDIDQGASALARGDLTLAHAIFSLWSSNGTFPRGTPWARHYLSWTLMRMGALQQAVVIGDDTVRRYARVLEASGLLPLVVVNLALYHAVLGNLDKAQLELTSAEHHPRARRLSSLPAMKALVRAVLDCRHGRCADAVRMLDEKWSECEATLTGETLRPLRVIRAFALAAADLRSAGFSEIAIASAKPVYAGEYDFLGLTWREMATFLVTHQLTRSGRTVGGGDAITMSSACGSSPAAQT